MRHAVAAPAAALFGLESKGATMPLRLLSPLLVGCSFLLLLTSSTISRLSSVRSNSALLAVLVIAAIFSPLYRVPPTSPLQCDVIPCVRARPVAPLSVDWSVWATSRSNKNNFFVTMFAIAWFCIERGVFIRETVKSVTTYDITTRHHHLIHSVLRDGDTTFYETYGVTTIPRYSFTIHDVIHQKKYVINSLPCNLPAHIHM